MKRKRIAALMAGVDREYQQAFTRGMVHAARMQEVDLCVFNCQGHPDGFDRNDQGERAIFELPDLSTFDGAVLLLATIPTRECRELIIDKISRYPELPLVTVDDPLGDSATITFDDRSSVEELMNHLLDEHGVRSFALVTGPTESTVAMGRRAECMKVLEDRGITVPEDAIIVGGWVRDGGWKAAEKLLSRSEPLPEAIVCGNDDMALGVIERLSERGLNVPRDVIVTGFDALQEAEGRGLTTIRRPEWEAGKQAVRLLIDWIYHGRPVENSVQLPTRVIYGESCGCKLDARKASNYVRMISDERRTMEHGLMHAAFFFGGLAGVSGKEEAGEQINEFAKTWGAKEMYVCVDPTFLSNPVTSHSASYPAEMMLLSGWRDRRAEKQRFFTTKSLLPLLAEEHNEALALVFSPLYAMGRTLGYAVLDVTHATTYAQYSLLTLLSSALMSLSLQTTVRAYAMVLENKSTHDSLTGLYNRRGFDQAVPPLFEQAIAESRCFAILSCDMDDMKHINDRYGHLTGDKAICRMGKALRALEERGMQCIHISGDEFLAAGIVADEESANELLDCLRASIDSLNREDPWLCDIGASMGVYAAVPQLGEQLNDYLMKADHRMYLEKKRHHGSRK